MLDIIFPRIFTVGDLGEQFPVIGISFDILIFELAVYLVRFLQVIPVYIAHGHLLYFVIEAIRGRPLSPEIQMLGMRIGLVLLAVLMVFALYNDFSRL